MFGRSVAIEICALNSENAQCWVKLLELIFQTQFSPKLHQPFQLTAPGNIHSSLANVTKFCPQFISQRTSTQSPASHTLSQVILQ